MKCNLFSYKNGDRVVPQSDQDEIKSIIESVSSPIAAKGQTALKKEILGGLKRFGWSEKVKCDPASRISIAAVKDGVGLSVQVGNWSRIYADLIKFQELYIRGNLAAGVIILPMNDAARVMAANVANFERLMRELDILKCIFTFPLMAFGFAG